MTEQDFRAIGNFVFWQVCSKRCTDLLRSVGHSKDHFRSLLSPRTDGWNSSAEPKLLICNSLTNT
jgi:hypothetical protein